MLFFILEIIMRESISDRMRLVTTYVIGHLAHSRAYDSQHNPKPGEETALEVARQYGAGLLYPDHPAAQRFLEETGINLLSEPHPNLISGNVLVRRGDKEIMLGVVKFSEAKVAIPS